MTITFKIKTILSECISLYNTFLRGTLRTLGLVEFGRNFYDKNKKIDIPQYRSDNNLHLCSYRKNKMTNFLIVCYRLEIWPGFVTTLNEFENGLYICCDISHRILCVETLLQKM